MKQCKVLVFWEHYGFTEANLKSRILRSVHFLRPRDFILIKVVLSEY